MNVTMTQTNPSPQAWEDRLHQDGPLPEGGPRPRGVPGPRPGPGGPIPPHRRGGMVRVQFDQRDMQVLCRVFGDEDTAAAAAGILCGAPPEIQVLALQVMQLLEKEV